MASNLSIESPNFEKINKEAGQFTSDAIATLWAAFIDTRATERRDFRQAKETLAPKVLILSASASVNDLDLQGASILSFIGATGQNLTGFRAPSTGESQIVFVQVNGAGTITVKHNATSESANRIITSTAADVARATNTGIVFAYLSSNWREVART